MISCEIEPVVNKSKMNSLSQFISIIEESSKKQLISDKIVELLSLSNYSSFLKEDEETCDDRKSNINELIAKAVEWEQVTKDPTLEKFLEELSQVAKASNVKILSITPMETKKTEEGDNPYYSVMLVKITAKSGYHQLGGFVSSLENGKRFIEIEDIIIKNDEGFPRRHDVEMVLKTYVSVENEEKMENENKK